MHIRFVQFNFYLRFGLKNYKNKYVLLNKSIIYFVERIWWFRFKCGDNFEHALPIYCWFLDLYSYLFCNRKIHVQLSNPLLDILHIATMKICSMNNLMLEWFGWSINIIILSMRSTNASFSTINPIPTTFFYIYNIHFKLFLFYVNIRCCSMKIWGLIFYKVFIHCKNLLYDFLRSFLY